MAGKVTSITEIRSAVLRREKKVQSTNRLITILLLVVAALVLIGLPATISASSTIAYQQTSDRWYYLWRQLAGLVLGTVGLFVTSRIPYRWYRRAAFPIFTITVLLLIAVLVVGRTVGGATSWIQLGPVNFQPTELAKFAVIVALATALERKQRSLSDLGHFLAPLMAYVGIVAFLVMQQPDLGGMIIIGAIAIAVLTVSAAPLRYVSGTAAMGAVGVVILASLTRERLSRITAFLDPWADPTGDGFQLIQSYYALGTGGLFGTGLGMSRARWFYLPNAHTDFIFAIIGEETGFIGAVLVLALFALLAGIGWMIGSRASDSFGRMLAVGITAWLTVQALVNVGGVLGVLPITGVTLPFVSYGGTSLAITMAVVGVLVNIAGTDSSARPARSR